MTMTVAELMEQLEACDPKAEVRIGTQSSYPFQNSVAGVVDGDYIIESTIDLEQSPIRDAIELLRDFNGPVDPATVYILEGRQLGYLSKRAWDAIR